jgi:multicomponent Na+:H+ antiporter subunit D
VIRNNLPALIVTVPLLAGLVTPFTRKGNLAWAWVMLVVSAVFAMCVALVADILGRAGAWHYPMGSWQAPWGIEYRVDALNAFVLLLLSGIGVVTTFAARVTVEREIPGDRRHIFYAIWLLCLVGLMGITITGDCFNTYVLLEIASLAMYALVAMGKDQDRRALTASMNYVVLGTVGASFYLIGIGYLYMVTGTLNMADMGERLQAIHAQWAAGSPVYYKTVISGFAFLMAGLAMKLALFPVHGWMPNAYTYAPSAVSTLLPATATKVAAYLTLRWMYTIVGKDISYLRFESGPILLVCGSCAVVVGSWFAIRQNNAKRLLAYSSVGQVGYLAIGMGLSNAAALQGSIIHFFNHALMKGGLFMALAAVAYRLGGTDLARMRGLGRRMPLTMAAFVVGGLALIGMPLTAGFVSKWYLLTGAAQSGSLIAIAAVVAGSLLAVVYVWRVVEIAYFQPAPEGAPEVKEAPPSLLIAMWLLVGATLYFGIDAGLTSRISAAAVRALGMSP